MKLVNVSIHNAKRSGRALLARPSERSEQLMRLVMLPIELRRIFEMCTCIEDLEQKLTEHLTEKKAYKKPIAKVEMMGRAFILTGSVGTRTKTDFEVTLEGQKKKDRVPVFHKYCPFCGEKKAA